MSSSDDRTRILFNGGVSPQPTVAHILTRVRAALEDKGYRPVDQIVGYLLSGDPAYITGHMDARLFIRQVERDELLEEIVRFYLEKH